jgi:type I restriction enzyme M protein
MAGVERAIVSQLWSYCNVLRDDGLSYPDYVEQLTYLLFLKMADEVGSGRVVPEELGWQSLASRRGSGMAAQYDELLHQLGSFDGMLGVIFADARNKIRDPKKLELLVVDLIDRRDWNSLDIDVKGSAYEGLLEKNAQDTKSGAGQYFTPRPLIDAIVECIRPRLGEVVYDPACGTAGFLISAYKYMSRGASRLADNDRRLLKLDSVRGSELVQEVTRLASMNLFLHGIGPDGNESEVPIITEDSLVDRITRRYEVVLSNPPFGKRSSGRIRTGLSDRRGDEAGVYRPDLWVSSSNKELNFLQHVANLIAPGGRAAIIVPDGVLTGSGAGAAIRRRLLSEYDVHTLLRLPTGLFYAQGINANVLFFDRPPGGRLRTVDRLWVYDLRSDKKFSLAGHRFAPSDIDEFVNLYSAEDKAARVETWSSSNREGRWRAFAVETLLADADVSLDISWGSMSASAVQAHDAEELISSIVADLEAALGEARKLRD